MGSLKLSLHHIFSRIGFECDVLSENGLKSLDLVRLKEFWGAFCAQNDLQLPVAQPVESPAEN